MVVKFILGSELVSLRRGNPAGRNSGAESGFTLAEVVVAVLVLGILTVSIFTAFSSGSLVVQTTRENLRATQILEQKMETIRLFTWLQGTNTTLATPTFTDWYDPVGAKTGSGGALYRGFVSVANAPAGLPAGYRDNMRAVTVTLYWTNQVHGSTNPIVRSRQMSTFVARYGMQNYIYR